MNLFELFPLENQLCFSTYGLGIAINRIYRPFLDELGLTYPQYLVLSALWECDGKSVSHIASRLGLDSSAITPLVKRLEHAGFVARRRGLEDERQVYVDLTDSGHDIRQRTGCLAHALAQHSGMTASELGELNKQICRLRDSLNANS